MNSFYEILKQYWGYDFFRPLQEEIITSIYKKNDTLGLMPTAGGKSLTFQVPTLNAEGICIVVTPLISLMKDQVDTLRQKGIKAAMIHSGMNQQEIMVILENCTFSNYKFLYVSPERVNTKLFLAKLQNINIYMIAIDESHCISQWGYDFRPSYLQIVKLRDLFPDIPVLALTATATPEVIDDIQEKLHFKKKNVFRGNLERKNITYVVRRTEDKFFEIVKILKKISGSGIVYVRSRKKTKEITIELQRQGIVADFFHSGLTTEEKIRKQNNWKSGQCQVIVCTNAFGMGIDKPDVKIVIHFELPSSLEEYFQETGRAGRDGRKSYAVALFSNKDESLLKKRVKDEFPEKEFIKDVYEKLAYFYEIGIGMGINTKHNFVIEQFCSAYHYNITHVDNALKILAMSKYIEYTKETDKQSKLIFKIDRNELYNIEKSNSTLDNIIRVLLRSYTGLFTNYAYINEKLLSQRANITLHELYESLTLLSLQNVVHYVPIKKVPTIYFLQDREESKYLKIPSYAYEERLDRLKKKIDDIITYSTSTNICRSKFLLNFFGEKEATNCGQCDVCLSRKQ
ncbi:ATP-dependent DNA helicase RecQ [Candidatus Azobacteroides pseudotrichonymphae genomovar. CFP2]|uniref:ATP-dependent DNA helicase RecQ n=1 Tax=Azobacteroides pseudotrichonymphae genomovar. CFP2 TaxID=511995 RepID=B6YQD3_AZOPC|nr:ATP-dependent DNA helicase RecQ [Candidatus Azobacteroides pseudotrichonymphae genomovar. CFP2]